MINVKIVESSDLSSWDHYIRNREDATPYHLSAWNSAITSAYGHQTFYLIAENDKTITGALPLCLIKPPIIDGTLFSLPYCDLGGIICDDEISKTNLIKKALDLAKSLGKTKLSIRERDTSGNIDTERLAGQKVSMLLDLPDSSESLFSNFKSKLRSQIRKAEKNGLTFESGREDFHVKQFFNVFSRNMKQLGSPTHSYEWFNQIRNNYALDMIIGLVKKDDIVVGAGILLILNNRVVIPWASTLSAYNRLAPNMLLYWNLLKYACDIGCTQFDFGRSTFDEGTYRFKRQWGAKPVALNWQTYNSSQMMISAGSKSNNKVRAIAEYIWSRLPLGLANSIGPLTRKYISL